MKKIYFSLLALVVCAFASAQIVNIPDANFKAKLLQASSNNQIASIQTPIYNETNGTWSVTSYTNIDTNNDGQIQVSEAQAIKWLNISYTNISNVTGINTFINLEVLDCSNGYLTNLDVSSISNLQHLNCSYNDIQNLNVSGLINLKRLLCTSNQLTNLNVLDLVNLQHLDCFYNELTSLDVSGLFNLLNLICPQNQLQSLTVSECVNLQDLRCENNQLTTLNVSGLTHLQSLNCSINQLTSIDFSGCTAIQNFYCNNNYLTYLDVSSLTNMYYLYCSYNLLENITLLELPNLIQLYCYNNQLSSLDISGCPEMYKLRCENNLLNYLFIKNNNQNWNTLEFNNNPNLIYVCTNENRIPYIQSKVDNYGYYETCQVNNYCSFNPGGIFYTIQGGNQYDYDNNGCNINDISFPNLKFNITNGTNSGVLISNSSGSYTIPVSAGSHTITPQLENSTYFFVSPTSLTVEFPTNTSPFTQDFCITANGVHHDLETVIIPLNPARPGFDAVYKIKYKNIGNQIENAVLDFNYNDAVLDLVSTSVTPTTLNSGHLYWSLGSLNPFQEGEIFITFNLNSPTETPSLNAGNELGFDALITPIDDNYPNNQSSIKQIVVNSYDPNDKTCLEGNTINSSMIGQYLHYMIRFENTGTFPAENIVVKDIIDTAKFDVSTLQMTDASHSCYTKINGNKVEFIFENINLDFNDATNDGYVVFKIKTLPTLAINAQVTNTANIYFDYNFPITTNTATTNFTTLANNSFDFDNYFTLAPIPAKNILTISNKQNATISSISIYNILGQVVLTSTNPSETIEVSSLKTGNYFIKIVTDKGISASKFVKE